MSKEISIEEALKPEPFVWTDKLVQKYTEWYNRTQGNLAGKDVHLWGKDLMQWFKVNHMKIKQI